MAREITRRQFLKITGCGMVGLYVGTHLHGFRQVAEAAIPGGSLNVETVEKFATALLIPPVMPKAGYRYSGGTRVDYYEVSVKQFVQQILPAGMPATTVWGYGPVASITTRGVRIHNAPSLTFEAKAGVPVRVKWINGLVDRTGAYLPHLLPVDPTLHWANPPGGIAGRDTRPIFAETPGPYRGPVPIVTHLHGAAGVGDESDGYSEAWYLPRANNIPAGYATQGTWRKFFASKALKKFGVVWQPGYSVYQYPNENRASTLWYHDHALGITRVNVYAGPAGFYIVRGGSAGDAAVLDSRTCQPAVLPGPAPKDGDGFPTTKSYYEIPLAIQDRSFNTDGSLFYPDTRAFFDGITEYIPETDVPPIWNPEFFGNSIIVNGNTWPHLNVEQRRYRFRLLNGCQSRFLIVDFSQITGAQVWQIGNEGGFLAAPVNVTASLGSRLLMSPAERADIILDFTNVPLGGYVLGNVGPDEPFGGGQPGVDFAPADPATTGQIMQFNVLPAVSADKSTPPEFLRLPAITSLPAPSVTRPLALLEMMSMSPGIDGPVAAMLGVINDQGNAEHKMWSEPVTENPAVGATEVWELYNLTEDAHPMHVHEVLFQVVNRQALVTDAGGPVQPVQLAGDPRPPEPWESGFKDTVIAYPGEVTRIRLRFLKAGQFVWHCHIVEHEDNEMMRPYRIGPVQPGQPKENQPQVPGVTRYEQSNSNILYLGKWVTFPTAAASGGSYKYADSPAIAFVSFNGTKLDLIATTGTTQGKARVYLDGVDKGIVDFYSASTLRMQKVWTSGTLTSGVHKVLLSWLGEKGAAGGTRVNVDAVDITGTIEPVSLTTVEQTDSRLSYDGQWTTLSASAASGGSTAYANSAGSRVTIDFTGSFLVWLAKTASVYGIAKVTLDGGAPVMVDLYSSTTKYKQPVWNTGLLPEGPHTVVIEWTGTKNASSTKTNIGIDAVQVLGTVD